MSPRSSSSSFFPFFAPPPNIENTLSATPDAAVVTVEAAVVAAVVACSVKVWGGQLLKVKERQETISSRRAFRILKGESIHTVAGASSFAASPWTGFVASSVSVAASLGSELATSLGFGKSAILMCVALNMQYYC